MASKLRATSNRPPLERSVLRSALEGQLDRQSPQRILHLAASLGDMHLLKAIIGEMQRTKAPFLSQLNSPCYNGQTPAMLAAAAGHSPALRFLMRSRADVARKGRGGFTALDYAVLNGHQDVARLLRDPFSRLA